MDALVIGLDGATWRVLGSLLDRGRLPNLERLIEHGASGTLHSTSPPMTPLAWTSAATGVDPGEHGIYDFFEQDTGTYRIEPVDYDAMSRPAIWDICTYHDTSIGVVNYPIAYPPPDVDGFFISGIPATSEQNIYRPDQVDEVLAAHDYRLHSRVSHSEPAKHYFSELCDLTTVQREATIDLYNAFDVDLLWTVFMGIDWIQHYLWYDEIDGRSAVERFYEYVDNEIGQLIDAMPEECPVIVLSDHGARPVRKEVHMNSLLEKLGYVFPEESTSDSGSLQMLGRRAWAVARQLPSPVKQSLKRIIPREYLRQMSSRIYGEPNQLDAVVDWEGTTAFSYGSMGRMFIHDSERYDAGTVAADEYDAVRQELIEQLEAVTDPETGEPLFESIKTAEEAYGHRGPSVPDLLVEPVDWRYSMYGDFADDWIHDPPERVADHEPEGILILSGHPFQSTDIAADIVDVAPTILHLMDLPVVNDMTGQVLTETLTLKWRDKQIREVDVAAAGGDDYGIHPDDREQMRSRLEDLGYL